MIGVFDTVGSLGLPEELVIASSVMKTIFGFNDRRLGDYVERAYHAMAINEMRGNFVSTCLVGMYLGMFSALLLTTGCLQIRADG